MLKTNTEKWIDFMDSFSRKEIVIGRLKFITMSLIGILLFLVPIPVEQDGQKQTTFASGIFSRRS